MRKFDTKVQFLKYKVLREVARLTWANKPESDLMDIPKIIVPGKVPTMRCCVYKERAILGERVKLAIGKGNTDHVIEVIDIACDECPAAGYEVTVSCRGCLANRCEDVCKKGAISFDAYHVAHIDKSKCVECGACAKVCPFSAIINRKRPCQMACKVKAISISPDNVACIDNSKCIACGACVYQCPFGAITDKSSIVDVIRLLQQGAPVYAVIAPSFSGQFTYAKPGQVVTGLKKLGFKGVVEAALGADMVAKNESKELSERGSLLSSCCPAFVAYVEKNYPSLIPQISGSMSPMATVAAFLKERDHGCRVVFIGPCTAKKAEAKKPSVRPYIDEVLTFEELQALYDSRDIELTSLEESPLEGASYFGRIFARCGGLSDAVAEGLKEQGIEDFDLRSVSCDGIEACKMALLKKSKNLSDANFIEGMACVGGCVGGAGCLTHGEKNRAGVDSYSEQSTQKSILDALNALHENHKN